MQQRVVLDGTGNRAGKERQAIDETGRIAALVEDLARHVASTPLLKPAGCEKCHGEGLRAEGFGKRRRLEQKGQHVCGCLLHMLQTRTKVLSLLLQQLLLLLLLLLLRWWWWWRQRECRQGPRLVQMCEPELARVCGIAQLPAGMNSGTFVLKLKLMMLVMVMMMLVLVVLLVLRL